MEEKDALYLYELLCCSLFGTEERRRLIVYCMLNSEYFYPGEKTNLMYKKQRIPNSIVAKGLVDCILNRPLTLRFEQHGIYLWKGAPFCIPYKRLYSQERHCIGCIFDYVNEKSPQWDLSIQWRRQLMWGIIHIVNTQLKSAHRLPFMAAIQQQHKTMNKFLYDCYWALKRREKEVISKTDFF